MAACPLATFLSALSPLCLIAACLRIAPKFHYSRQFAHFFPFGQAECEAGRVAGKWGTLCHSMRYIDWRICYIEHGDWLTQHEVDTQHTLLLRSHFVPFRWIILTLGECGSSQLKENNYIMHMHECVCLYEHVSGRQSVRVSQGGICSRYCEICTVSFSSLCLWLYFFFLLWFMLRIRIIYWFTWWVRG